MPMKAKKKGGKNAVERPHFFLDRALVFGLGDDHPGEEGADQRRQADVGGEGGEAEAEDHRRQQRRLGEAGSLQQQRPSLQQLGPAERDEGDEGNRHAQRQGDLAGVDAAVGGHPDRDREQDQRQHVVDDGGAEHGPGGAGPGDPEVEEGRRGDPGAGRRQSRAEEDAGLAALAQRQAEPDPGEEGDNDAGAADCDRDLPNSAHLRKPRLQPDPEEEEDDAQLGEDPQHLADLDPAQDRWPDEDAAEDLADDRRLPESLEDLVSELRRDQHQEEVGEDRGGVGGGEGEG